MFSEIWKLGCRGWGGGGQRRIQISRKNTESPTYADVYRGDFPRERFRRAEFATESNYVPVFPLQSQESGEWTSSQFRDADKEKGDLALGNMAHRISTTGQLRSKDIEKLIALVFTVETDHTLAIQRNEKNNNEYPNLLSEILRNCAEVYRA